MTSSWMSPCTDTRKGCQWKETERASEQDKGYIQSGTKGRRPVPGKLHNGRSLPALHGTALSSSHWTVTTTGKASGRVFMPLSDTFHSEKLRGNGWPKVTHSGTVRTRIPSNSACAPALGGLPEPCHRGFWRQWPSLALTFHWQ